MNYIYWAHLPEHTDKNTQGYIGVTCRDLSVRMKRHFDDTKANSQYTFHRAIRKYKEKIIWEIIAEYENEKEAYTFENFLRPKENIGWNNAIGGSKPPVQKKGKKQKSTMKKLLPEQVEYILNSKESSNSLGKKFNVAKSSIYRLRKKNGIVISDSLIDKNIYIFNHLDYGQEICTQLEFKKKYNLDSDKVSAIIKGKRNTHKGWSFLGKLNQ